MSLKVSIITAVYNNRATIADCLESVAYQDYGNIEHIIVDGASIDGTLDVVNDYRNNVQSVKKVISEKDNGIYDAFNKGIKIAEGDIVGVLNSDDFYAAPNIVSQIVEQFEATDTQSLYGDLVYVKRNNLDKTEYPVCL